MTFQIRQWDGKTITEPGIYAGIPLPRYHEGDICDAPSVSSSGLRTIFMKSPADYFVDSPYNKDREEVEDDDDEKPTFIIGRAAHHLFLGERNFGKEFVVRPDAVGSQKWNLNAGVCKEWLKKNQKGRTILTPKQWDTILRMAKVLSTEPLVKHGILHGHVEHSLFVRDAKTGFWLKARPDAIPNDSADFSDYKTTVSIEDEDCSKAIHKFGYHQQAALVGTNYTSLTAIQMNTFNLVFQQKKPPHSVNVVEIKREALKRGMDENGIAFQLFVHGMKTGDWPGPNGHRADASPLGLRKWDADERDYRASKWKRLLTEAEGKGQNNDHRD